MADALSPAEIEKLLESNQDISEGLYLSGLVYLNRHKEFEAKEAFKAMLEKDPQSVEAQWGLAEVLRRDKDIEASGKMLNKVIEADPQFWPAYITLAYLKYTQADFDGAVRLALKVRSQGRKRVDLSNYTRSYLIFAGAKGMIASTGGPFSKLINGTQVLPNLKKAEKLQPDSVAVLFGLGSFYFLAPGIAGGSIEKAIYYLERAVEEDPLFADAYVRLAQVYKAKEDIAKYRHYLDKAKEVDPENELLQDEKTGMCKFNCVTVKE